MRTMFVTGALLALAGACRDVSDFDTRGDHFEGAVASGSFVRSGLPAGTQMCLTLDTTRLQDGPGVITTSDGRFRATPLRPIPQVWHDPLSTLSFGDGRRQNLLYALAEVVDGGAGTDIVTVVSLMQSGAVEVRLLRGAPREGQGPGDALFGVFTLERRTGGCPL